MKIRRAARAFPISAMGVTAAILLLSACNGTAALDPSGNEVYDAVGKLDLSARPGFTPNGKGNTSGVQPLQRGVTYIGANADQNNAGGGGAAQSGGGEAGSYQIDYEDAPVGGVAKSIIVDALGLGLSVDPRVDGRISISSGRPLTKNQLLLAFENSLRANNAALLKDGGGGYRVVPASETNGVAPIDRSRNPEPGAGISVVPLRYISADNVVKLLDGFATKPGAIRFDQARNMLLIQGSSEERRKAMETALAFDQDFMRGQSVGVYPVSSAAPETLIAELQKIMDAGEGGAYKGFLQFQPVERLGAVMVIARKPDALRAAATWIARLDRSDSAATSSHVYKVKYGDARKLATLLNSSFGGGGGGGDTGSTEPGADRLSLSSSGSGQAQGGAQGGGFPSLGGAQGGAQTGGASSPFGALSGGGGSGGASSPFGNRGGAGAGAGGGALGGSDFGQSSSRNSGAGAGGSGGGGGGGGKVRITADVSTNALLIFADRQNYKMIESALRQLDRPSLQVAIEATIAEVTLNDSLQYGVQYFLQNQNAGNPTAGAAGFTTSGSASPSVIGLGTIASVLPGANFVLGPGNNPRIALNALTAKTNVKVLSNPSVVVLDNQVAAIQVGDQVPVATGTISAPTVAAGGIVSSTTVNYLPTGVILHVLPRVSSNGSVTMEIEQEISNVSTASSGSLTPTISQRHIRSSVSVASGQTVVLGGLVSNNTTTNRSGIPVLSSLAFLGDLFAQNQTGLNRTELVVFIRPQIITDAFDAQAVAEQMRSKMLYQKPFRR